MTVPRYFADTYCFSANASVRLVKANDSGKGKAPLQCVVLDETIFHPQGGGQPWDLGVIKGDNASFNVVEVRKDRESSTILHIGSFADADPQKSFLPGEKVTLEIDEKRRRLCARIHSAGHLLDVAMSRVGVTLEPSKGYHFPDAPYVEYIGSLAIEPAQLQQLLDAELARLIADATPVDVQEVAPAAVAALCPGTPTPSVPADGESTVRVVTMSPGMGCPCGGTHVQSSAEIGKCVIRKVAAKKNVVRVSYIIE